MFSRAFQKLPSSCAMCLIACPLCREPHFGSLESLRIGLIKVATESLTCPVCSGVFIGLDKLTIHLFSHCDNVLTKCSEDTKAPSPDEQLPVFNALPFIGIPEAVSNNVVEQSAQSSKALTEKCDVCGFFFLDKNILQVHKKLIHNIQDDLQNVSKKHACHLCSKVFKMRGSLMVHLRMVHASHQKSNRAKSDPKVEPLPEVIQEIKVERPKEPDPPPAAPNKQWKCDICQKHFTTKYFLKKHKRLHTGEMPYSCKQCNKTFTFQQSYHKHLLYHNDDKPHACSHCGRSFKELSTLHNHQRIHTGEKPFSCESCGKCFRQRVSYLVHRRIHTGVMPYKCTACDKSFRYKVSQRTHKCIVQPPGMLVRQSGELVQKLIKSHGEATMSATTADQAKRDEEVDGKNVIDELISDSIRRIDFDEQPVPYNQNLPSPSEKFSSLTLSSNESMKQDFSFRNDFVQTHGSYDNNNAIFEQIYK